MNTLDIYIAAHRYTPFAWLRHDCVSFGGDWVRQVRGVDPIPEYRGVAGLLPALRVMRALGGYKGLGDKRFGAVVRPRFLRRGDVALVASGRKPGLVSGYTFGVCTGTHIAVPGVYALVFLEITAAVAAWRP